MASEAPALAGTGAGATKSGRRGSLGLLSLTILSGVAMQNSISPVQQAVKLELGLSDLQTSLIQGLAVSIPVALLALPLGRLTDRGNRVRLLFIMALVWTAGMALTAFAGSFATLFAARMLANIGAILAIPIAISIASDLSEPGQRGRALLPLSLGKVMGQALAFLVAAKLYGVLSADASLAGGLSAWRGVQLAFALFGAALLLPMLLLREPARREQTGSAAMPFRAALAALWSRRGLLVPLFIGQVTVVMADGAALIWAPTVLERDFGLAPPDFGLWLFAVIILSGLAGSVIGGIAADLGHRSRLPRGILIGAVGAALLAIPGAFFPLMPGVAGFAILLALLMLCGTVTGLVTATAIAVLVPNELRGLCLGAFMVVGAVVGYGLGPVLATLVSQLLGGEHELRLALALTTAAVSVIAAIGFVRAMRGRDA